MGQMSFDAAVALLAGIVKIAERDAKRDPEARAFLQEIRRNNETTSIPLRRQQMHSTSNWSFNETENARRMARSKS